MNKVIIVCFILLMSPITIFTQTPDWQWATQAGGNDVDNGWSITTDNTGNNYITGSFRETATFGLYSIISNGYLDIFVAKINSDGNWQWATQAGGNNVDNGSSITTDNTGNSYVTGAFSGTANFGQYSITSNLYSNIFVAKINSDGNWLWAVNAGGNNADYGWSITIDNTGNIYVTGAFSETATFGSYSITSIGGWDIFIAKMDSDGNWLWATRAGGSFEDRGHSITTDNTEYIYVTGAFSETATFGSYSITSNGGWDIFIAKMDSDGNWLWATQAGGSDDDCGGGITTDDTGNAYVTGGFYETATFGQYFLTSNGSRDIFVAKIDSVGNWLWVIQAGGNDYDSGSAILADDAGNTYVTGSFYETATFGQYFLTSNGSRDIFVAKIDSVGNWLWVTHAGGNDYDSGSGISADDTRNTYVTGVFRETATFGSYSVTSNGINDIFVAKLNNESSIENDIISVSYKLSNYPNPFNPETIISFTAEHPENAKLEIYNIKGQKIKTLIDKSISAGNHTVVWNGKDANGNLVCSGVYLYKLEAGDYKKVKKMVMLK